ncbi:peptidoglycan-binding domain-containing protein [Streptomyces similanensis]|uniref:Peptidoglycan binding-like domain-containing protein n=1 Tax=Streptomyces similanensis TaxID=1274988 RepID=A0ABP9JTG3_9ACTN|nr:peptidoglycan-binding protein [Streptomyces seoulensis]
MPRIRSRKALSALSLAVTAAGSLLLAAPSAHAGDYLDSCLNSVGSRTSPNGVWTIPARTFSQGSSGVCVQEIQFDVSSVIGLDPADFPGFVDGRYGPKTDDYVRRFQRAFGLQVDGIVGPQTWQLLIARTTD